MPYELIAGTNPLEIAEQQYASGPNLQFTTFTSCIGVIAKKGDKLTGVHLVMIDRGGNLFGKDAKKDVNNVLDKLEGADNVIIDKVTIFGEIGFWRNSESPEVRKAFGELTGKLGVKEVKVELYTQPKEGIYGAEIDNIGKIKITSRN